MTSDHVEIGVPGVSEARQIGSGAFGRVYRARQDSLDRTVAVKVLANVDLDDEAQSRFDREGKAVGQLSGHPNIVAVYSQGVTDRDQPFLMMEYCPGGSYGDRVRADGRLDWAEATEVAVAICGALDTAHQAGILHRDVKPDNILIDDYDTPKLADFGIARVSKAANLTQTGTLTGSPAHMPPELVAGQSASPASDVYSLASTLHALVAGSPAFVRDSDESIVPLLKRISFEDPPALEDWGVPAPVADVVRRAMTKEPAGRPASCAEFGDQLNAAREAAGQAPARMKIHGDRPVNRDATRHFAQESLAQETSPLSTPFAFGAPDPELGTPTNAAGAPPQGTQPTWPSSAATAPSPWGAGATRASGDQRQHPGGPSGPTPSSGPSAPSADSVVGAHQPFGAPQSATQPSGFRPFQTASSAGSPFSAGAGNFGPSGSPFASPTAMTAHPEPVNSSGGGRHRRRNIMIIAVIAMVLVLGGIGIWRLGAGESATNNGSTGLLVDPTSVDQSWIPTNTVHLNLTDTACGNVGADFGSVEHQGYRLDGASTPQWSTVGAPAASPEAASAAMSAWNEAFSSCSGPAREVTSVDLPNLDCACDNGVAWRYVSESGQIEYVGMVRKGSSLAAVMAQTAPGSSASAEALFNQLLFEAANRAEATG